MITNMLSKSEPKKGVANIFFNSMLAVNLSIICFSWEWNCNCPRWGRQESIGEGDQGVRKKHERMMKEIAGSVEGGGEQGS